MSANESQVGGTHYKGKGIEPWDYIASNNLGFFEGNAIKYLSRWKEKGGIDDLKKAKHYIDKLIEMESSKECDDVINWISWGRSSNISPVSGSQVVIVRVFDLTMTGRAREICWGQVESYYIPTDEQLDKYSLRDI